VVIIQAIMTGSDNIGGEATTSQCSIGGSSFLKPSSNSRRIQATATASSNQQ